MLLEGETKESLSKWLNEHRNAPQSKQAEMPLDLDKAWNTYEVIAKLIEASEILLHKKDYDGHGHEEILTCCRRGKEILKQIQDTHRSHVLQQEIGRKEVAIAFADWIERNHYMNEHKISSQGETFRWFKQYTQPISNRVYLTTEELFNEFQKTNITYPFLQSQGEMQIPSDFDTWLSINHYEWIRATAGHFMWFKRINGLIESGAIGKTVNEVFCEYIKEQHTPSKRN